MLVGNGTWLFTILSTHFDSNVCSLLSREFSHRPHHTCNHTDVPKPSEGIPLRSCEGLSVKLQHHETIDLNDNRTNFSRKERECRRSFAEPSGKSPWRLCCISIELTMVGVWVPRPQCSLENIGWRPAGEKDRCITKTLIRLERSSCTNELRHLVIEPSFLYHPLTRHKDSIVWSISLWGPLSERGNAHGTSNAIYVKWASGHGW